MPKEEGVVTERWHRGYSTVPLHSALGFLPPPALEVAMPTDIRQAREDGRTAARQVFDVGRVRACSPMGCVA